MLVGKNCNDSDNSYVNVHVWIQPDPPHQKPVLIPNCVCMFWDYSDHVCVLTEVEALIKQQTRTTTPAPELPRWNLLRGL